MLKLAAIVGPTAVGKSHVAIRIAQRIGAEIISCDSMQVYRGMDIGTAKVTDEEQKMVKHHLIDLVDVDSEYNVAEYQKAAQELIRDINQRNKIPLLVGGTGLYYQSVVDNYQLFPLESTAAVRKKYMDESELKGIDYLYEKLQHIDPVYADKISPNDRKRIVRALEVFELTGKPFSHFQVKKENTYQLAAAGLYLERKILYQRIENRVEEMLRMGFIEEVEKLLESGYNLDHKPMQALGYKQVSSYLQGFITREQMADDIKRETRRFAKRQFTWFNRDPRINWFDVSKFRDFEELAAKISEFLEGQLQGMSK